MPWARCSAIGRRGPSRIGKFMTDPIWWLYLFWMPDFLNKQLRPRPQRPSACRSSSSISIADVGSIGGGWLSSALLKRGWSVNAARKTAMLLCAAGGHADRVRRAGRRTCGARCCSSSLAAAAHQGWSANLFTLTSDMFPRRAVGSVVGIGGMAGRSRRHGASRSSSARSCSAPAATCRSSSLPARVPDRAGVVHFSRRDSSPPGWSETNYDQRPMTSCEYQSSQLPETKDQGPEPETSRPATQPTLSPESDVASSCACQEIESTGVVAVIRLKEADKLRAVVDALIEGGVRRWRSR